MWKIIVAPDVELHGSNTQHFLILSRPARALLTYAIRSSDSTDPGHVFDPDVFPHTWPWFRISYQWSARVVSVRMTAARAFMLASFPHFRSPYLTVQGTHSAEHASTELRIAAWIVLATCSNVSCPRHCNHRHPDRRDLVRLSCVNVTTRFILNPCIEACIKNCSKVLIGD